MNRSNRERAHSVPLARCVAGKSGASPEGRRPAGRLGTSGRRCEWSLNDQLNVPGSPITGSDDGDDMMVPPCSQHGAGVPQGSQAGAQAGAPQGGAIGAAITGAPPRPQPPPLHGERNSINDGRRQVLFEPPKQLVHPGAATRLPRTIAKQTVRDMIAKLHRFHGWDGRDDVMRRPRRRYRNLAHVSARGAATPKKFRPRESVGSGCAGCARRASAAAIAASNKGPFLHHPEIHVLGLIIYGRRTAVAGRVRQDDFDGDSAFL